MGRKKHLKCGCFDDDSTTSCTLDYQCCKQGPRGYRGLQGAKGEKGPAGPQGPEGEPGQDGRDGLDGRDGRDGLDGRDGRDGPQGPAGPVGDKGDKGHAGAAGPAGEKGDQGPCTVPVCSSPSVTTEPIPNTVDSLVVITDLCETSFHVRGVLPISVSDIDSDSAGLRFNISGLTGALPPVGQTVECFAGHWSCCARTSPDDPAAGLSNTGQVIELAITGPDSILLTIRQNWHPQVLDQGLALDPIYFEVHAKLTQSQ